MNKAVFRKTILFFILICICVGCRVQDAEDRKDTATHTATGQETKTEQDEVDVADTDQEMEPAVDPALQDPKNAKLLCLQSGDTETLLGISFGDRTDYTRFEWCGSGEHGPIYCEIDAQAGVRPYFFFQGKGHGFSGFLVTNTELGFLGLDQRTDKLERLTDLFGEPDEFDVYEKDDSIGTATWNFEKASLHVVTRSEYVSSVEYLAVDGVADGVEIPWEQSDFAIDCHDAYDHIENIYQWEATCGSDANETEAAYHPYDDDYDADYVGTFIEEYLKRQGIQKTEPDGTVFNRRGEPLVEYYIEESENKYCFVVHLWGDYWIDYDAGISEHQDAVYCTTHVLEDADQVGTFLYHMDEENEITRERLYDTEGMRKSDISYKNMPGVPLCLITNYWYIETGYDAGWNVLCRNQKFWFDEEQAALEDGYFTYPCTFSYDENGRLKMIEEELLEEDKEEGRENSGQAEFQYDGNGILAESTYSRSSWTQGTTDCSGTIEYDEKGRMIRNDYYITHGGHTDIFLYKDGADLPWARLNWCSFAPGFTSVYLFL